MRISYKVNTLFNWFVVAILLVAFFYNAYRYPLQINASSTSPTYSSTPFILKAAKYIIFTGFYAIILYVKLFSQKSLSLGKRNDYLRAIVAFMLSLFPIYWGLITRSISILETGFFFFTAFIMHLFYHQQLNIRLLGKVMKWVVFVALLFNLAQVLLFIFVGRLPALAYANSISVRFGSLLDDPNGFGILIPLFLGFSYYYFRGIKKWVILLSLMLCLLLTQSLTAIAAASVAVGLSMLFYVLYQFKISKQLLMIGVGGLSTVVAVFIIFHQEIIEMVTLFFMLKAGSIEGHAEGFNVLLESNILNILGMVPLNIFSEMGYVNLLTNFGIVYTLIYIAYGAYAIQKYFFIAYSNRSENKVVKGIACGGFLYLTTFYIAMLNLPLEQVFPINVIAAILLGLVNANLIRKSPSVKQKINRRLPKVKKQTYSNVTLS